MIEAKLGRVQQRPDQFLGRGVSFCRSTVEVRHDIARLAIRRRPREYGQVQLFGRLRVVCLTTHSVTLSAAGATQLLIEPPLAANSAWSAVEKSPAAAPPPRRRTPRTFRYVRLQLVVGPLLHVDVPAPPTAARSASARHQRQGLIELGHFGSQDAVVRLRSRGTPSSTVARAFALSDAIVKSSSSGRSDPTPPMQRAACRPASAWTAASDWAATSTAAERSYSLGDGCRQRYFTTSKATLKPSCATVSASKRRCDSIARARCRFAWFWRLAAASASPGAAWRRVICCLGIRRRCDD